eukprot:Opistho-1_new@90013
MRRVLAIAALTAIAAAPASPVDSLAGRYSEHSRNGLVDGTVFWSDDVIEIVPVDRNHAYIRFALHFYNGHECSISGVAKAVGNRLVYQEPKDEIYGDRRCKLSVWRSGDRLVWADALEDGDGIDTCSAYCGARGSFKGDHGLAASSRRRITYLPRLKASSQYRDAIANWKAGKND